MSRGAEMAIARERAPLALAARKSIDEAELPPAAKLERRFLLHEFTAESRLARFPIAYLKRSPRTGLQ
jgi:hypothetical protein